MSRNDGMNDARELPTMEIVQALIDQHARVAARHPPDRQQHVGNPWRSIAVDGEVIMAEFTDMREAEAAVVQLFAAESEPAIRPRS